MTRMRRFTAKEVEKLLQKYNFQLVSQKGSHRKWRNEEEGLQVIVPERRGKTLPIGTSKNILKTAKIPESDWIQ